MNTKQIARRIAAVATAAALVALSAGAVSAGNTRILYVGDPDGVSDGLIRLRPANVGTTTFTQVLIKNNGKQNLTKGGFGIGSQIATVDANGNPGQQLPAGWTVRDISSTRGTCAITANRDGASCDLGTLNKGASAIVTVYLFAGSTSDVIQVSGRVAENQGGNVGANSNTFFAVSGGGSITPASDGTISGYFKGGKVKPFTPGTTRTEIDLGANSNYLPVSIDDNASGPCPSNVTCLPGTSKASVNGGNSVSPAFTWTSYFVVKSGSTVKNTTTLYHYFDNGTFESITAKGNNSCSTGKVPCADFSMVTISGTQYLQIIFKTTKNGLTKSRL